ncbi:MAG TPA: hypothetical protein VL172_21005 [Kofleriaceae bacterium]|jgi:hypothetical protein|nr:hypothetical protein [Kofleriaceae bacterium]
MPYRTPGLLPPEPAPEPEVADGAGSDRAVGALLLLVAIPRIALSVAGASAWGAGGTIAILLALVGLSCLR